MPARRFDPKFFLERVGEGRTIANYQTRGIIIYRQGERAEEVYYLQSGSVKETVTLDHGKEITVGILEPGQFFGTSGLNGGTTHTSSTRVIRPATVTVISNSAMKRALEEPAFAQMFVAYLLHHNSQIEAEKYNLLLNRSEKRLARLLLLLAHASEGPPQPIAPTITQDMLADMVSTTRQRVNMFMRKFQKLGFIDYAGGIRVNPSLLTAVLNDKV